MSQDKKPIGSLDKPVLRDVEVFVFVKHPFTNAIISHESEYPTVNLLAANDHWFKVSWRAPPNYVRLLKVFATAYSTANGNVYWRMASNYGANGENRTTHGVTLAYAVEAVITPNIHEFPDVATSLLTNLAVNDYVGIKFERDATNVLDTMAGDLICLGLVIRYVEKVFYP